MSRDYRIRGNTRPWLLRAALIVYGYFGSFSIIGRPDNLYWGLLISPLLPLGVVLSPLALRDLIVRAYATRRPGNLLAGGAPAG